MKGLMVFISLFITNCSINTGTGLVAGSILGSGAGSLVASNWSGVVIGGIASAIGGGLVGLYLDQQDRNLIEKSSPRTLDRMDRGEPLTMNDIIKLSQSGVVDETVIQYMKDTGSSYHLSQSQVRRLQDAGVSQKVIDYMIDTGQ